MYILVIIQTDNGGAVSTAAYKYDSLDEAKAAFYAELASGASSKALRSDACVIMDASGWAVKQDCVTHEAVVPDAQADSIEG